ncbi:MAG TPA: hypothetical protein DHW20_05890 [Gemmatimonadetes bacterium]|nr:hypothetical protein [Gemmatimonadota bacterium]
MTLRDKPGSSRNDPEDGVHEIAQPSSPTDEGSLKTQTTLCDLCGAQMIERHCKLICLSCGYQRDCSDP